MIGRRAGGNNCGRRFRHLVGRYHAGGRVWRWALPPPAVAAETLPVGGDLQHGAAAFTRRAVCDSDSPNTFSSLPASTAPS